MTCAGPDARTAVALCGDMCDEVQLLNSAFNVAADCWLLALPMPHVLGLQMPRGRKVGLVAVFAIASA